MLLGFDGCGSRPALTCPFLRLNIFTQDAIDLGSVIEAVITKPLHDVPIDANRDRLFAFRPHYPGVGPVFIRHQRRIGVARRRTLDVFVGHRSQGIPIGKVFQFMETFR